MQVGQRITAGAPLMSVIPLDQVWVEANFKEGQLRSMRIGQPVKLHADLYGSRVEYHGRVAGLGAGTGAAFALLPAQNATGNWIKVVQRVPVRVELDREAARRAPVARRPVDGSHSRRAAGRGAPVLDVRSALPRASSSTAAFDTASRRGRRRRAGDHRRPTSAARCRACRRWPTRNAAAAAALR